MRLEAIHRASLGLRVTFASLVAIAVVLTLTVRSQVSNDSEAVRKEAVNLARLITKLPATAEQPSGWELVLRHQLSNENFVYGLVESADGKPIVSVTASGILVPPSEPMTSGAWVQQAERLLGQEVVIEYHGPLRFNEQVGHFRIGFRQPGIQFTLEQLSFIASLMLPVFLLTPIFLYFMTREVDPLKKLNAQLVKLVPMPESQSTQTPTDIKSFSDQFNLFLDHAKGQIEGYQLEKSELLTSGRFLSYRLNRFESIFNSVPEGLMVLDGDACVSFANVRLGWFFDLQADELIGAKASNCLRLPELQEYFAKHEQNIHALVGEHLVFKPEQHPEVSVSVSVHPLQEGAGGSGRHHVVVFRDVTAEVRAQQSRSEFVAHLAHELKAPLHTLSMYSEALQNEEGSTEEFQLEATNVISDEVERLSRLINNLLSMNQIEMGTLQLDRQRIKLVDLVRDTTETMERSARGRELKFELDLPNDVIPVQIDKDMLRIAINNLLTNAIKYTDPGGTITVSAYESADAVTICVADTGIGISSDEQTQIFHKFYRVTGESMEDRTGHGLGLPLARDIVEMHHGSMRVESELGEGSRFYIDLWKHAGVVQQAI